MKPIIHAQNSVKKFGGTLEDYLPIHELMDIGKSVVPDVRHRMLFHHKTGIPLLSLILGDTIKLSRSSGKKVFVNAVTMQHIEEDLGSIPSLNDYLNCIPDESWHVDAYNAFIEYLPAFAKKAPALSEFVRQFVDRSNDSPKNIILVCNSLFPYIAEKKFGPMIGKKPTRDLVEHHIRQFVEIYPLSDLLEHMSVEDWMIRPGVKAEKSNKARVVRPKSVPVVVEQHHHHHHHSSRDRRVD